jgi:penicillin-binding protein 1A
MKKRISTFFKKIWKKIKKSPRLRRVARRTFVWGGSLFAVLFLWAYINLPSIDELNKFARAPSVLVKSEDGKIIGSFGDIYGDYISYDDFPKSLIDAVVATEDRSFFSHIGIDIFGLMRATVANMRAGHVVQGGSTITQQVAKNVFLTPERSMSRKFHEMMLALAIERKFTKKEIIGIYLNRVYLGAGNYGVDSAARRYFGKSARDLRLSESAILAGMLKAPSRYAPTNNPVLAKKRAEQVLLSMQDAGFLTKNQVQKASTELDYTIGNRQRDSQSSFYFADWIMDQLPEFVGNIQEDLVVTTTIKPELQTLGDQAIASIMDVQAEKLKVSQASLLAMSPDGAVRAMVGGRSYAKSQYNRVTQALRQPGSSFKLFVYLAGLESGIGPDTVVTDGPITLPIVGGTWSPKNYTNKYLGEITIREAVAQSVNTVAVRVSQEAGLSHVIGVARRLGITSDMLEVPSIALGATEVSLLEMTGAYAHLANNGVVVRPYGILRIDTASGNILYQRQSADSAIVLRPDVIGRMNEMLKGVVDHGTGGAARIGRPVAGKTGTTSDYKDAWFIGFTPELVAGVWVGNDDNMPMKKVTGGMLPAQIWHNFMQPALANEPSSDIPTDIPSGMPWQKDLTNATTAPPQEDEPEQAILPWQAEPKGGEIEEQDAPPPEEKRNDVKLGQDFWDKLDRAQPHR